MASFPYMIHDAIHIQCPTCFETFAIEVDPSAGGDQDFVIDCEVCCRPMSVLLRFDASGCPSADVTVD